MTEVKNLDAIALRALNDLKTSISGENVRGFSYFSRFGVCWHLFANTKEDELCADFLQLEALPALGLDTTWPVERQVVASSHEAMVLNYETSNMYDESTEQGKIRLQLIDDLIEYFNDKIHAI